MIINFLSPGLWYENKIGQECRYKGNYARSISSCFHCLTIVKVSVNRFLAQKLCIVMRVQPSNSVKLNSHNYKKDQSSFSFYSAQPNQSYTNSKKKFFFTTLITLKQKKYQLSSSARIRYL